MGAISCKWNPDHIWERNQSQLTAAINRRIPSGIHLARQSVRDGSIIKFRNWERSIGSFRRSINVPNLYWALKNFYEIGDCHRPLQDTMDWDCKERKQNTYWTQQKGSPMHFIMIVCKMKMLSDNRDKIESIPVSLCVLGFEWKVSVCWFLSNVKMWNRLLRPLYCDRQFEGCMNSFCL